MSSAARRRRRHRIERQFSESGHLAKEIEETVDEDDEVHPPDVHKALAESDADAALVVLKASASRHYTLGLAYGANLPDVAIAADGKRDVAGEAVVEKAAWSYLTDRRDLGLFHQDGTEGHGTVVESYIYRGPDWEVGDTVIKAGDWLMGVVWDPETWPLVESGFINGFSPQGRAARAEPTDATLAKLRRA